MHKKEQELEGDNGDEKAGSVGVGEGEQEEEEEPRFNDKCNVCHDNDDFDISQSYRYLLKATMTQLEKRVRKTKTTM